MVTRYQGEQYMALEKLGFTSYREPNDINTECIGGPILMVHRTTGQALRLLSDGTTENIYIDEDGMAQDGPVKIAKPRNPPITEDTPLYLIYIKPNFPFMRYFRIAGTNDGWKHATQLAARWQRGFKTLVFKTDRKVKYPFRLPYFALSKEPYNTDAYNYLNEVEQWEGLCP